MTGAQAEALVRRLDRQLTRLENTALATLRQALQESAAELERELRTLYRRALDGTASAGAHIREAAVRDLLEQTRVLDRHLDLRRLPTEAVLSELQRGAMSAGAENALQALTTAERAVASLSGAVPVETLVAATNISSRLQEIGAARAANGAAALRQHGQRAADAIQRHVTAGIVQGRGWGATSRLIRREVGLLDYEAERIVRTESITASDEARRASYADRGVEFVRVLSTLDDRVCGYCARRSGEIYRRDDIELPFHPNCVVGDTHVLAQGVRGHSKRWYEGPIVTVTTRVGNSLTCTPNHPILTRDGWVPAGSLNVGSHVISHVSGERVSTAGLDDEYVEGSIEEVIDTLSESPEMVARPVPVAAEHFHGDGAGSEVAVIGADRHLWDRADSALQEHRMKLTLLVAFELGLRSLRSRPGKLRLPAVPLAAPPGVCGRHLPLALSLGHLGPLDRLGFTLASQGHASVNQMPVNDRAGDTVLLGEGVGAAASVVGGSELVGGEVDAAVGFDSSVVENLGDAGAPDLEGPSEFMDSLPFAVELDDVVGVERRAFSGHVYNLETSGGYYVADGIVTHNCRCTTVPARPEWAEAGIDDPDWYENHRAEAIAKAREQGHKIPTGPAPSERWRGRTEAPQPVSYDEFKRTRRRRERVVA